MSLSIPGKTRELKAANFLSFSRFIPHKEQCVNALVSVVSHKLSINYVVVSQKIITINPESNFIMRMMS